MMGPREWVPDLATPPCDRRIDRAKRIARLSPARRCRWSGSMRGSIGELVSATIDEIRSMGPAWQSLRREERFDNIRRILIARAQQAGFSLDEFARETVAQVPSPAATAAGPAPAHPEPMAPTSGKQPVAPADPVDQIMDLVPSLSPDQVRQLLVRMRGLELIPHEAPRLVRVSPVGRAELSDGAIRALAHGLDVPIFEDRDGEDRAATWGAEPVGRPLLPLKVVLEALGTKGVRREELSADRLAFALGHLSAAVNDWAAENETPARGLGQTLRTVRPQRRMVVPVELLWQYLAAPETASEPSGVELIDSPDAIYGAELSRFFEPYRELAEKFGELVKRLAKLALALSPPSIERKAPPKPMLAVDNSRQLWTTYVEQYGDHKRKGFIESEEQIRHWLMKEWLG
jgi:hypothetical protein